jgi:hypothetical protein
LTQREALTRFEEAFAKRFTVTELPEDVLEARWAGASDPFLAIVRSAHARSGARRGGRARAAAEFPIRMTTVREFADGLRGR